MSSWKDSTKYNLNIITPPSLFLPSSGPTIFLAGSMNFDFENHWRESAVDFIRYKWFNEIDEDITIFNPRRENWSDDCIIEQTSWNIHHIECSNYIILHLTNDAGVSPESLLEIGLFIRDKKMFISIESEHPKRIPLEIHIAKYGINPLVYSYTDSIELIKTDWLSRRVK